MDVLGKLAGVDDSDGKAPTAAAIADALLLGSAQSKRARKRLKGMRNTIALLKKLMHPIATHKDRLFSTAASDPIRHSNQAFSFDRDELAAVTAKIHGGLLQKQHDAEQSSARALAAIEAAENAKSIKSMRAAMTEQFGQYHVTNLEECEHSGGEAPVMYGPALVSGVYQPVPA